MKRYPYQGFKELRGKEARYVIPWSPYIEMDRYLLHGIVPSEGGLLQVFVNMRGQLFHLMTELCYYGGLRNRSRELIDPLYVGKIPHKKIIQGHQCFMRYCLFTSMPDMEDIMYYFEGSEPSGRYEEIYVDEKECRKVRKV